MVLVPGITRQGKDDPRLVAFAETLARARFEVLVPDLPNLRDLRVDAADARVLADAVAYLERRRGGQGALAMTGVSYAVGPAILALFEPGAAGRVDVVVAIGGYYDLEATLTFFTTGHYREAPTAQWRHRTPNAYGKWVFVRSNAGRLEDAGDRALVGVMAERKLADPGADVADLAARLGSEGRAVHALLANRDPDRVPALIAALPAAVARDIRRLDLKRRDLASLRTRFVLVHGRDDPIIPESESRALAAALAPGRAELTILESLNHVDPQPAGLVDKARLLGAIYTLLAIRDEGARR
jgi:pimeloyl-ACP methyl ester carboxylesterase